MRLAILAFAAGVMFLQWQAVLPPMLLIAALSALALAAVLLSARRKSRRYRAMLYVGCAVLGFGWAGGMAKLRLADQLPEAWETRDIEMTGVIASLPQRFERGERFEFVVESVHTDGASVPRRILLSWYRDRADPAAREPDTDVEEAETSGRNLHAVHPGERWRLFVRLKRPHGNANPYGFDYEAWLLERDLRATGSLRAREPMQRLADFVPRPAYAVERLRELVRDRFLDTLPAAPYLGVLMALAVGDQRAIPNTQWTVFNRTGVTHLVSISGLHVTMVAALFALLINILWRRSERLMLRLPAQKAAIAAGWLAALSYALLAGFGVPAQRTLFMLSVVALALWSGRNFGVSRVLLLALLVVLLLDPWAVLSTGFWLSFGAVGVLLFVGAARVGDRTGWWARLARWGLTQWAVTIGSVPLLLLFFQQFSLVSPLANALAIPFISFIVTPLALIYALLPWPPLLQLDHWLLAQLMRLLEWLAQWPMWQQAAPPLWAALLAVAGVFWLLLPRGFPARWLGLVLLLPALVSPPPRPAAGTAWIDVLDVGQGLAVVARTAAHTLLYDTGPQYGASADAGVDAGARVVLPYLRAIGVGHIDTLVVSHRDQDHSGGATSIRAALPVTRVLTSITRLGGENCVAGQAWDWEGVRFSILHPLPADYQVTSKKTNNMSCVLRIETGNSSLLLTADIEAADEKALIARSPEQLASRVLVVPHHGGKGSSSPEFVAAVGARDAVFSVGYRNSFKHPRPEVLARYAASRHWRTDRDGAIQVVLDGNSAPLAWRQARARYWHGQ